MKLSRLLLFVSVLLGMATSCARPTVMETFVKSNEKDELGRYGFVVDMEDSTCVYDLYLFTKVDCTQQELDSIPDIGLVMRFVSPSGSQFEEEFCIEKAAYSRHESFSVDYMLPYRIGLVPKEYGLWQLYVTVPQEDAIIGFCGIGLQLRCRGGD